MINLTKYEKYILIFLIFTGLLGAGLLFYKNASNRVTLEVVHNENLIEPARLRQSTVININTATKEELATLKGIGPALAARIVEYRKKHGYFSTKEDLRKVSGIGPAKFEDIKEMIKIE